MIASVSRKTYQTAAMSFNLLNNSQYQTIHPSNFHVHAQEHNSSGEIDTEESLHQRIIGLYEAIEKKSINNIQSRNKNEVLRAQLEAYQSIIVKIKETAQISSRKTQFQSVKQNQHQKVESFNKDELTYGKYQYRNQVLQNQLSRQVSDQSQLHNVPNLNLGITKRQESSKKNRSTQQNEQSYEIEWNLQRYKPTHSKNSSTLTTKRNASWKETNYILSPRPTELEITQFKSPGKSFLRKSDSRGSMKMLSNIDIEDLWNEAPKNQIYKKTTIITKKSPKPNHGRDIQKLHNRHF